MRTATVKKEEEADTRIIVKSSMKYREKERGHQEGGGSSKQGLTSTDDLTMELSEGRESP